MNHKSKEEHEELVSEGTFDWEDIGQEKNSL